MHQDTPSFVTRTTTAAQTLINIATSPLLVLGQRQLDVNFKGSEKVSTQSRSRDHENSKQLSQKAFDQAQAFACTDLHENLKHVRALDNPARSMQKY